MVGERARLRNWWDVCCKTRGVSDAGFSLTGWANRAKLCEWNCLRAWRLCGATGEEEALQLASRAVGGVLCRDVHPQARVEA